MSNSNNRNRNGAQRARAAIGQPDEFTFRHNGRAYSLPPARDAMAKVKAGVLIDLAIAGDDQAADMRMGMAILRAAAEDITPEAMTALRDMNIMDFGRTIGRWMRATGADPGKSEASST